MALETSRSRVVARIGIAAAVVSLAACGGKGGGGGGAGNIPTSPTTGVSGSPPAFTLDDGTRFLGVHPAPVVVNGMTYVYQNTGTDGTTVEASADGITFALMSATFPAGISRTIVAVPGGRFRMYYFPDASSIDVRSAVSSDGLNWTVEDGTRYSDPNIGAIRATAVQGGGYRLYFPISSGLGSAMSTDGLTFTGEGPVSITASDGTWGPSAAIFASGAYHMVLTKTPASGVSELWHAVSSDGRSWTLDRVAIAANPTVPLNQPAWAVNGGVTRLYFRAVVPAANAVQSGIVKF